MENKYKIIFIGAGVANLVAANRLLDYSIADFIIIEQGDIIDNRKCTGEKLLSCKKCIDGCSTLEGVGGANANNGNKLCYFPASSKISESFSLHEINTALKFLNNIAAPYFDICFNSNLTEQQSSKKYYNSDVLSQGDFKNFIKKLTLRVQNKIIINTQVSDIDKINSSFEVKTTKGINFHCDKLVLGTGRSSYKFIKTQFERLSVKYSNQAQDIGIRIEAPKDSFTKEYYYQVDPKFKFEWTELGTARTFCAHNQGKVVPVRLGNAFFVDGAFGNSFGSNNNIALMVRTPEPLNDYEIEFWCQEINKYANDSLLIGKISLNQTSSKIIDNILSLIPSFPTKQHRQLMENLLFKLFNGEHKILNTEKDNQTFLTIYAPAIDRQWVAPKLNVDFSAESNNNLYILGDAIGKSRGFVQAMFSGAIWVDRLNFYKTLETEVKWSNLV